MGRFKRVLFVSFLACLIICDATSINSRKNNKEDECNLSQEVIDDIASYSSDVDKIIDYFIRGPYKGKTFESISTFVDKFGPRLSGSQVLEDSIDYMLEASMQNNLENIHTHQVEVPHWVRGEESATLLKPRIKKMAMLGLGTSVPTPIEGITAQVIVVKSFDELNALSEDQVRGKILVYDEPFTNYGETSDYRSRGASEAAKKGAIAALVRSITPFSIASPHTGSQKYAANVTKIPAAAITLEDADLLRRIQNRGEEIIINLKMSATQDTKISRNMIADLTGYDSPNKIVVVSGHIDSWDVGDGSMDDAGGCFISWVAPIALKTLGLRPRRTLRTLFFTAEELGLIGAEAYALDHKDQNDNLNFVMESDSGTFAPLGLRYEGSPTGACMVKELLKLFSSINATELLLERPGSDITVWTRQGIPGGGLHNNNGQYFWYHHAEGDTLNVLDSDVIDFNAAFWTAVSYIIADMKNDIPRE